MSWWAPLNLRFWIVESVLVPLLIPLRLAGRRGRRLSKGGLSHDHATAGDLSDAAHLTSGDLSGFTVAT